MGVTFVDVTVIGPTGIEITLNCFIDSGVEHTLVPLDAWQELGLHADREERFQLFDGTHVKRNVAVGSVRFDSRTVQTSIILGEIGDEQPLLGTAALYEMGLNLHPFTRQLEPNARVAV